MTSSGEHIPVLAREVMDLLNPSAGQTVVDATIGYGGHAALLLEAIGPEGTLIGLDVDEGNPPRILDAASRLTVLLPGSRCLLCRNVVDPNLAREEHIRRTNPEEYAWQHEHRYVRGNGGPSLAVVTFTTDLACMAIDELLHRLTG